MRDYVIVTDSCCDFPPELVQELGVTVIPLSVQLGKDRFHNTPEEAPDSHVFYTRLSQGEPAQTSAPNVEEFKDCFRPFLQAEQDVLYLGFSSGLSGTYHNAAIAAEELREEYRQLMTMDGPEDQQLKPLVKAADKLSAVIKCVEERKSGNRDFAKAEQTIIQSIEEMHLPEADYFLKEFLPSYGLTIEEQDYTREAGLKFSESSQMVFSKVLK